MSNEMKVKHQIGETNVWFCIRNSAAQVAVVSAGVWQSWATWNNSNVATYAVDATDKGGGEFMADFPTSTPAGRYDVEAFQGSKDATADSLGGELLIWNGIAEELDVTVALETTVASVPSADITIRLTAGPNFDDAFYNAVVSVTDVTSGHTVIRRIVSYDGTDKDITFDYDAGFSIAAGDIVRVWACSSEGSIGTVGAGEIAAAVWNALDASYMTVDTKGLRLHHAVKSRY